MKFMSRKTAIIILVGAAMVLAIIFSLLGAALPGGAFASGILFAAAYITVLFTVGRQQMAEYCSVAQLVAVSCSGLALLLLLSLLGSSSIGSGSFMGDAFAGSRVFSIIALNISIALAFGAGISGIVTIFLTYDPAEDAE